MSVEQFPLPPHGKPPPISSDDMPCTRCGEPTPRSVLNHLGARCSRCYEAYLREPMTTPKETR